MPKQVSIITTFRSADEAYSLNRIVINQIKMFVRAGYQKIKVVVAKGFKDSVKNQKFSWYNDPAVELIEISDVPVDNIVKIDDTFDADVQTLYNEFSEILKTCDVAITHDIVYQPAAIKHNIALRKICAENKEIRTRFLHWIHSATNPNLLAQLRNANEAYVKILKVPFPRSFYIAFNEFSIPRVASWFGCEEDQVKYVPHPHDFLEYTQPLTNQIVRDRNLLQKDVVCMYPCRLDRGKQPHIVLEIMAQVKNTGKTVGLVIADFHSTAGDKVDYREEMKTWAERHGLDKDDYIFLSEFGRKKDEGFNYEFPHQVINELFEFTNVFILPSVSETYSLVAQEAAAKRNFLILNQDFPPFRSIYGDSPYYRQFSSNMNANSGYDGDTNTNYGDRDAYFRAIAHYINYALDNTRVLKTYDLIRKTRNLDYVFKHYIEPILYVNPAPKNFNY